MKKLILYIAFFVGTGSLQAQEQFVWARNGGGQFDDQGRAIATDANGNIFITGIAEQNAVFGSVELGNGWKDIFIVKYSSDGDVLWAKSAGSGNSNPEGGYGICTDIQGNCYVTGAFEGTASFDGTTVTSQGEEDMFIAKYNPNGELIWAVSAGGIGYDNANSICVHAGHLYVTGKVAGIAYFGVDSLTATNGGTDFFIAQYDTNGNFLKAINTGGIYLDEGFDIDCGNDGSVYATGFFTSTIEFETDTFSSFGRSPFIVKYDASLNEIWAKAPKLDAYAEATSLAVSGEGHCIVAGFYQDSILFGGTVLPPKGEDDIFLASYDGNGEVLWATPAGGTGRDWPTALDIGPSNEIYLTGKFRDTAQFGQVEIISNGYYDAFVAQYGSTGTPIMAVNVGSDYPDPLQYDETGSGICVDLTGNCYITGTFYNTASFPPNEITSNGIADVFVAKIAATSAGAYAPSKLSNEIRVYPNPAKGRLLYLLNTGIDSKNLDVEVYDIHGQKILSRLSLGLSPTESKKIHLNTLKTGAYLLNIREDSKSFTRKIVIEP